MRGTLVRKSATRYECCSRSWGCSHASDLSLCLSVSLSLCLSAVADAQTIPINVELVDQPRAPIIVGASNCSGLKLWDLTVEGADPSFGGKYVVSFGNAINSIPFADVGSAIIGPDGRTTIRVDISSVNFTAFPFDEYSFLAREERRLANGSVVSGPFSLPYFPRDPRKPLPLPVVQPLPLWNCGAALGVAGHQPGDQLFVTSTQRGSVFNVPSAYGTFDFVGEIVPALAGQEEVFTRYRTCEGTAVSAFSQAAVTRKYPKAALPRASTTSAAFVAGVTTVPVQGVENGARVNFKFTRSGMSVGGSRVCAGGEACVVGVPGTFLPVLSGDAFEVTQELCPGSASPSVRAFFQGCASAVPRVVPPKAGDVTIRLLERALRSTVSVWFCATFWTTVPANNTCASNAFQLLGESWNSDIVSLNRAIAPGERLVVTQSVSRSCPAVQGDLLTALSPENSS